MARALLDFAQRQRFAATSGLGENKAKRTDENGPPLTRVPRCISPNGKKSPSPTYALSVWRKTGGRWVAVAHGETPAAPAAK